MGKIASNPVEMNDYQAQDDARTLVHAENIKSDKGRHKAAVAHASKQAAVLQNIAASAKPVKSKAAVKPAAKPTKVSAKRGR